MNSHRLAFALRASATYDLVVLCLLLWMPTWLLELFSHPEPAEPFLFRLAALPLLMMPVVYTMAGADPIGRPWLVVASIRLRVVGGLGILLLVLWQKPAAPGAYLLIALADLAWAASYDLGRRSLTRS